MKSSVTEVTHHHRHHRRAARCSRAASRQQRSREIYPLLFSAALRVVAPRSGLFEPPFPPLFFCFLVRAGHACVSLPVFSILSSFYLPSSSSFPAPGCDSCVFVSPDPPNARKYLQSEMKARQSGSDLSGLPTGCGRRECDGVCGSLGYGAATKWFLSLRSALITITMWIQDFFLPLYFKFSLRFSA